MNKSINMVVGTWGLSAFDTAPWDASVIITSLYDAWARVFDSALVYGSGSIDACLGQKNDVKVISKIPALHREKMWDSSHRFADHYPRDHVCQSIERLLSYHQGSLDTLLFHNWHVNWSFEEAREVLNQYRSCLGNIGISARYDELGNNHQAPLIEIPIDPVINRIDDGENIGKASLLVRSPFCHWLLLYDTRDSARCRRFSDKQQTDLAHFREQHETLSSRMQTALGYICQLPLDIRGVIVGITQVNQWHTVSQHLRDVQSSL